MMKKVNPWLSVFYSELVRMNISISDALHNPYLLNKIIVGNIS